MDFPGKAVVEKSGKFPQIAIQLAGTCRLMGDTCQAFRGDLPRKAGIFQLLPLCCLILADTRKFFVPLQRQTLIYFDMKKVLFVLVMALMSLGAQAQIVGYQGHVDEYDIQGRWVVTSYEGRIIQLENEFEYMSFSGNQLGRLFMKEGDDIFYSLWFISNSNKLHISLNDGHVLNFVIMDYKKGEQDYMKLKTFDDACTIELKMDWPVNHINSTRINAQESERIYNLQGVSVDTKDGVYIQNGQKYISK